MKRRTFLATTAAAAATAPLAARAQERLPVVGWLGGQSGREASTDLAGVLAEMAELGWVEARDFTVAARLDGGDLELLKEQVAELIALGPAVIAAGDGDALFAAAVATADIPPARNQVLPPVVGLGTEEQFLELAGGNFAKPVSNVTGIVTLRLNFHSTLVKVLADAVSGVHKIGIVHSGAPPVGLKVIADLRDLDIVPVRFETIDDLAAGLESLTAEGVDAAVMANTTGGGGNEMQVAWAAGAKIPVIYTSDAPVEIGGLMSYAVDRSVYAIQASYVVRILEGAAPADLPIVFPPMALTLNLKTATEQGIAFEPILLFRADRVIE